MQEKLLLLAFEKAKIDIGSDVIYTRARHLSEQIYDINKAVYGEKSLSEKYKGITRKTIDNIHLRADVLDALSKYLDYDSYRIFLEEFTISSKSKEKHFLTYIKKHRAIVIITLLIISSIFIYNYATRQRWMVWQEDHYVEVDFDVKKYGVNKIKVYKEERILYFKKVKSKCEDTFFDKGGNVLIWYGKNHNKDYEFFTALGLHPETGKTLKPITQYIIDKHICKE